MAKQVELSAYLDEDLIKATTTRQCYGLSKEGELAGYALMHLILVHLFQLLLELALSMSVAATIAVKAYRLLTNCACSPYRATQDSRDGYTAS
jgi:hypothetical protein